MWIGGCSGILERSHTIGNCFNCTAHIHVCHSHLFFMPLVSNVPLIVHFVNVEITCIVCCNSYCMYNVIHNAVICHLNHYIYSNPLSISLLFIFFSLYSSPFLINFSMLFMLISVYPPLSLCLDKHHVYVFVSLHANYVL